jgi:hypothetical protein
MVSLIAQRRPSFRAAWTFTMACQGEGCLPACSERNKEQAHVQYGRHFENTYRTLQFVCLDFYSYPSSFTATNSISSIKLCLKRRL